MLISKRETSTRSDFPASNFFGNKRFSLARFKVVRLTCTRWYKQEVSSLSPTPWNHFVVLRVCTTTGRLFLYSESLQPRRSFFATLHPPPLLLRAPLPEFYFTFPALRAVCCLSAFAFFKFLPLLPAAEFYFALVCRLLLPRPTLPFISVHGLSLRAILFRREGKGSKNQRTYLCTTPFEYYEKLNYRIILDFLILR